MYQVPAARFKGLHIIFLCCLPVFFSCEKKQPKSPEFFYKVKIDGKLTPVYACGTSTYVAEYISNSGLFIGFQCNGSSASFSLKGIINDGEYTLDQRNYAAFGNGSGIYQTDSANIGKLTIKSALYSGPGGSRIPVVEGKFSFKAINKSTGKTITATSGEFLLKKYQY